MLFPATVTAELINSLIKPDLALDDMNAEIKFANTLHVRSSRTFTSSSLRCPPGVQLSYTTLS